MSSARAPRRAIAGLALAGLLAACNTAPTPRPDCPAAAPTAAEAPGITDGADMARVTTNKGEFTIDLLPDAAPIAVANFVALARCGFYDGITFHRVLAGFVIQAGDPQTRDNRNDFAGLGTGGPGYRFVIEPPPEGLSYDPYVVAMAHSAQPDSNGSQFFVNLVDLDGQLDRSYTIFGVVESGRDVVDAIGQVPTNGSRGVPLDPVIIGTITIEAQPEPS
jgi:dolichyl-diphosphooligosaccharide--protein glycosyltransferase